MKPDIWIDKEFVPWEKASVHPLCHGIQRGATVFESIDSVESFDGKAAIFRLRDHLLRFENSAKIIGLPIKYTINELYEAVISTVNRSGLKNCTIRPLAFYSDPVFDVFPGESKITVLIGIGEKHEKKEKIKIKISAFRKIDRLSMPVKAKVSGNYISPFISKSEAINEGFDDAVLLDYSGFIAEGASSNIFMVENGKLYTSPGDKILQGITRNTIFTITKKLGIDLYEELFTPERLKQSDEVFLSSSGMGVMPVVQVDNSIIADGKPGKLTDMLRKYYSNVTKGSIDEFKEWLTII